MMVSNQAPEPTIDEAFAERYRVIMQGWQSGDITGESAEASMLAMRDEAQAAGNQMNAGGVELNLGIIQGYLSNFVRSARHFETARQLFAAEGANSMVVTCDLNIGEVYRLQGDFPRARKFFHRAYEEGKQINNPRMMAVALTNEGQMWVSTGNYRKAQTCLEQAVEIARTPYPDEDDEHIRLSRLGVLAEIYHALTQITLIEGDPKLAWNFAKRSYDYAAQTAHPMRMGFGNRAIADVITALGEAPESGFEPDPDYYYKQAIENFTQVKMEGDIAKTLFARGNSLVKRGRKSAAAKLYQRALAIFSKLGMTDDATKVAEAQIHATR